MSGKFAGGIVAGSTSVSTCVVLRKSADNTEKTGVAAAGVTSAYYWRQGGTPTALTALSDLAAITAAWAAGGWKEADATHAPGAYRLDVDDGAFATGADWVEIAVVVATCYVYHERFALTTDAVQSGDCFARLGAPAGASIAADLAEIEAETDDVAAVKARTDNLPASPAAVGSAMTLAAASISDATFSVPADGTGQATGMLSMLLWLYQRFFGRVVRDKNAGTIDTYQANGTTVRTNQVVTSTGASDEVGAVT